MKCDYGVMVAPVLAKHRDQIRILVVAPKESVNMNIIRNLSVEIKTSEVLAKLRANREVHVKVFAEAKANYLKVVKEAFEKELAKLANGKYKDDDYINVSFSPPKDYTEVYDSAIALFELETRDTVPLDQEQFASLVLDKWHWKNDFLLSNVGYSASAKQLAKGSSLR